MSTREIIATDDAPAAIGAYSQAVKAQGLLFCSGQIAIDPRTGELVTGDAASQTERVLQNLGAVLRAGGSGWDKVLRVTIFLVDMADFASVDAVYARRFEGLAPPARATVAVKELPRGVSVEISCVALAD